MFYIDLQVEEKGKGEKKKVEQNKALLSQDPAAALSRSISALGPLLEASTIQRSASSRDSLPTSTSLSVPLELPFDAAAAAAPEAVAVVVAAEVAAARLLLLPLLPVVVSVAFSPPPLLVFLAAAETNRLLLFPPPSAVATAEADTTLGLTGALLHAPLPRACARCRPDMPVVPALAVCNTKFPELDAEL